MLCFYGVCVCVCAVSHALCGFLLFCLLVCSFYLILVCRFICLCFLTREKKKVWSWKDEDVVRIWEEMREGKL